MTREELLNALRSALTQLDDYDQLRHNPLLRLISPTDPSPSPVKLQRRLVGAIQSLQDAHDAKAHYYYRVLHNRYIEQLGQIELASQLGISERQLRRDQSSAIELLAEQLWDEFGTDLSVEARIAGAPDQGHLDRAALNAEVAWLQRLIPSGISDTERELVRILQDVAALVKQYQVDINVAAFSAQTAVAVPPVALRQCLLTILAELIPYASQSRLEIQQHTAQAEVILVITHYPRVADITWGGDAPASLQVAGELLRPFGGAVQAQDGRPVRLHIVLPKVSSVPILLVEDNPDTARLFQRFVENSRYHLVSTSETQRVVELAVQNAVAAAVLDIMLPDIDGWGLLAQLRHHPATLHLPIAICSILPQQALSQVLGANLFLQKPPNREQFLAALNALTAG